MRLPKKACSIVSLGFLALGVAVLGYDAAFNLTYGFDVNDVAGVSEGFIIDWPTGERPLWALAPAYTYSLVLWLFAGAAFVVRKRIRKSYSGRLWRGTE